jgi:hypothetical protein
MGSGFSKALRSAAALWDDLAHLMMNYALPA